MRRSRVGLALADQHPERGCGAVLGLVDEVKLERQRLTVEGVLAGGMEVELRQRVLRVVERDRVSLLDLRLDAVAVVVEG